MRNPRAQDKQTAESGAQLTFGAAGRLAAREPHGFGSTPAEAAAQLLFTPRLFHYLVFSFTSCNARRPAMQISPTNDLFARLARVSRARPLVKRTGCQRTLAAHDG